MKHNVSIVIPCYNSGAFLMETLESIKNEAEIIIVDDGSEEEKTIHLLKTLESTYAVFYKTNGGPASARNMGIKYAKGDYIVTLDSDNLLKPNYIKIATEILDKYEDVGVVYGIPEFFGNDSNLPIWYVQDMTLLELVKANYIDMCAVFRKKVWEDVGGLDENRMLIGHEDWHFWLKIASLNKWKFHFIPETVFCYRIRANSVTNNYNLNPQKTTLKNIYLYPLRNKILKDLLVKKEVDRNEFNQILGEISGFLALGSFQYGSLKIALYFLFKSLFLYRYKPIFFLKNSIYWLKKRVLYASKP